MSEVRTLLKTQVAAFITLVVATIKFQIPVPIPVLPELKTVTYETFEVFCSLGMPQQMFDLLAEVNK